MPISVRQDICDESHEFYFLTPTFMAQQENQQRQDSDKGFAAMDDKAREMGANQGGSESGSNSANNPDRAREAGKEGGSR